MGIYRYWSMAIQEFHPKRLNTQRFRTAAPRVLENSAEAPQKAAAGSSFSTCLAGRRRVNFLDSTHVLLCNCISIYLSVCLSACLSICLSVCLSIYHLSNQRSIDLYLSNFIYIYIYVYVYVYMYICIYTLLSANSIDLILSI